MKPYTKKEQSSSRELQDLERRASAILQLFDDDLREQFVQIAGQESPTQSYEKAFDLATEHFDARTARSFAKACRFLAIIRRDYGEEQFHEVV